MVQEWEWEVWRNDTGMGKGGMEEWYRNGKGRYRRNGMKRITCFCNNSSCNGMDESSRS